MHDTDNNYNQPILVNIMEEFVRLQAKSTIKELGCCECETCFLNVCALALNELETKYVTTNRGALLSQITAMEVKNQVIVTAEVTKAVLKVMDSPRHEPTEYTKYGG